MSEEGCPQFPIVPGVNNCGSGCKQYSMCKLPRRYPQTTALAALQTEYSFTYERDFNKALNIDPEMFTIPDIGGGDVTVEEGLSPCDLDEVTGGRAFYNYIGPMKKQENGGRITPWVLDYTSGLTCEGSGTAGVRKGPAYTSIYNAIREIIDPPVVTPLEDTEIIMAPTLPFPEVECEEGYWVLTKDENDEFVWTCERIPPFPPEGECEGGYWVLTKDENDKFVWTCESIPDIPPFPDGECSGYFALKTVDGVLRWVCQDILTPELIEAIINNEEIINNLGDTIIKETIKGPDNECENGTWVLSWINGKLQWVCSTDEGTKLDCEAFSGTVNLLVDGEKVSAITLSQLADAIVTVETDLTYNSVTMPSCTFEFELVTRSKGDAQGHKKIAVARWSSNGDTIRRVQVGPYDTNTADGAVHISGKYNVNINAAVTECYKALQDKAKLADVSVYCLLSVVECDIENTSNEMTVTCDESDGEITIDMHVEDTYGNWIDSDGEGSTVLGDRCDEFRAGSFIAVADYINESDATYVAADVGDVKAFTSITASGGVTITHGGLDPTVPDIVRVGETARRAVNISYKLSEAVCTGSITIVGYGFTHVVTINPCDEGACPTYMIESMHLSQSQGTGGSYTFDTNCSNLASLYDTLIVRFKSTVAGVGYRNRNIPGKGKDTITVLPTINPTDGITVEGISSQGHVIVVPDISADEPYKDVSIPFAIKVDPQLPAMQGTPAGGVTFSCNGSDISPLHIDIIKDCGQLSLRITRVFYGANYPVGGVPVVDKVNHCQENAVYTYFFYVEITNTDTEKNYKGTGSIDCSILLSGGLSTTAREKSISYDISLGPGETTTVTSPPFDVQVGSGSNMKGTITPSARIKSADLTINGPVISVNPDCEESSSSSESPTPEFFCDMLFGKGGVDVYFDTSTGKCTVALNRASIESIIAAWMDARTQECN